MATIGKYGKVIFSDEDIQFIKDNFQPMTNDLIADALGLKKKQLYARKLMNWVCKEWSQNIGPMKP